MFNHYFPLLNSKFSLKSVYLIGLFILVSCAFHEYLAKAEQQSLKAEKNFDQQKLTPQNQLVPIILAKNSEKSDAQEESKKSSKRKSGKRELTEKEQVANRVFRLEKRIEELKVLAPALKAEVITVTKMASTAKTSKERRVATKKIRNAENKYIAVVKELRTLNKKVEIARLELKNVGANQKMIAKIKQMAKDRAELTEKSPDLREVSEAGTTPTKIKSKKAVKEPLDSAVAKTPEKKKGKLPWFKKEKVQEKELQEDPLDDLERELETRSKGDVRKMATRRMQPKGLSTKSIPVLKQKYRKFLQDEAEACFQLIDAYTSPKIPKVKELSADKEYSEARLFLNKTIKELERAEQSSLAPSKG